MDCERGEPMNERAIFANREFLMVETIPALEGGGRFVLCSAEDGKRYVCPEELWRRQAPQAEQAAGVNTNSSAQEKIELFLSMFRGREDVYAKRYYSLKTGKSGYVPACKNEWEPDLCDKKAHRCPDCPKSCVCASDGPGGEDTPQGERQLLSGCGRALPHAGGRPHLAVGSGF